MAVTLISWLGAGGGSPLGAVHAALHAQARQLAEPGRDRSQSLVPRVSWPGSGRHFEALRDRTRAWTARADRVSADD